MSTIAKKNLPDPNDNIKWVIIVLIAVILHALFIHPVNIALW